MSDLIEPCCSCRIENEQPVNICEECLTEYMQQLTDLLHFKAQAITLLNTLKSKVSIEDQHKIAILERLE